MNVFHLVGFLEILDQSGWMAKNYYVTDMIEIEVRLGAQQLLWFRNMSDHEHWWVWGFMNISWRPALATPENEIGDSRQFHLNPKDGVNSIHIQVICHCKRNDEIF